MKYTEEELNKVLEEAPKNDKGKPVLSEEDFLDNLKALPNGTRSAEGKLANNGGYLDPLSKGSARTREISAMGGRATQAVMVERKKIADSIDIFLRRTDENGVTMQDKIVEAMALKAMDGCVGAAEFIRDTVGEKPSDQVSLDVMTDGDKQLMEILKKRLGYDGPGSVTKQ